MAESLRKIDRTHKAWSSLNAAVVAAAAKALASKKLDDHRDAQRARERADSAWLRYETAWLEYNHALLHTDELEALRAFRRALKLELGDL